MSIKLLVAFAIWPWVIVIADVAAYMVVGHTVSPVTWDGPTSTLYLLWPIFWGWLFSCLASAGCIDAS